MGWLFFMVCLLIPRPEAGAVLGGSVDSFASDQRSLRSFRAIQKESLPLYSIHTIDSDSVILKEYVSQDGTVFAITWSGNRHPEIEPLLGAYQPEFLISDAASPRLPGGRTRVLRSARLQVQTYGHMRRLRGRIFDPGLVPKGVPIEAIQ